MNRFYANEIILVIIIAACINIGAAQRKFGDSAKIEELNVKQGGPAPAISSRFLDLGGVISQLFSGFNQGSGGAGGGPGLNLPPNSQFYPGVPAQNGYNQPPYGQGNDWSFFNQGNIQGNNPAGGVQNQQQWDKPNQNWNSNNNLQLTQNQGRPNFNNQNNNQNPPKGPQNQGFDYNGQPTSNLGNSVNNGQKPTSSWNEGTLDDFFTTERTMVPVPVPPTRDDFNIPDQSESNDFPNKNAIWGKLVPVPSSTPSNNIVFIDKSNETPAQKQCVQNCPTTSEYNPACGTDGVTYFNLGRLICARNCGINVFETRKSNCRARG